MKKLNTKNCCFLCLKSNTVELEGHDGKSDFAFHPIEKNQNLLRCLVRHLQINLKGIENYLSNIPKQEDKDVEVNLCESCAQLNNKFSKLFLQLEKIQMEMDFYLERIHHRILESSKNAELVGNYSVEMTSDQETLELLAFVDNLRMEIADKSAKHDCNPKVYLIRSELTSVETFEHEPEEIEDFDNTDHLKDQNPDECSPTFANSSEQSDIAFSSEIRVDLTRDGENEKRRVPSKNYQNLSTGSHTQLERVEYRKRNKGMCRDEVRLRSPSSNPLNTAYFVKDSTTGDFKCTTCHKSFKHRFLVRRHFEAVHLGEKKYTCDVCNVAKFYASWKMERHKELCNGNVKIRNKNVYYTRDSVTGVFQCTKCEKRSSHYPTIACHFKTNHLIKKRYKCDICNTQEFNYPRSLNTHKKKCRDALQDGLIKL